MERPRRGENEAYPFRTGRLFCINNEWFFATREGRDKGPYEGRAAAEAAVRLYLSKLGLSEAELGLDAAPKPSPTVRREGKLHPLLARLEQIRPEQQELIEAVAADVLRDPPLLISVILSGTIDEDPMLRARAAEVLAMIATKQPAALRHEHERLVREVGSVAQPEVRWHLCQIIAALELSAELRYAAVQLLVGYLEDPSNVVQVHAMRALAAIGRHNDKLRGEILAVLNRMAETGSEPIRRQGEKLAQLLAHSQPRPA